MSDTPVSTVEPQTPERSFWGRLADGRARFQEFAVDGLFVGQRNAVERQAEQRGTTA